MSQHGVQTINLNTAFKIRIEYYITGMLITVPYGQIDKMSDLKEGCPVIEEKLYPTLHDVV